MRLYPGTSAGTGRPAPPPLQGGIRGEVSRAALQGGVGGKEFGEGGGVPGDLKVRGARLQRQRGGRSACTELPLLARVTL